VAEDATDEEIRKAYYGLAKKYHPDANPGNEEVTTKKFQVITNAYDAIMKGRAQGEKTNVASNNRTSGQNSQSTRSDSWEDIWAKYERAEQRRAQAEEEQAKRETERKKAENARFEQKLKNNKLYQSGRKLMKCAYGALVTAVGSAVGGPAFSILMLDNDFLSQELKHAIAFGTMPVAFLSCLVAMGCGIIGNYKEQRGKQQVWHDMHNGK